MKLSDSVQILYKVTAFSLPISAAGIVNMLATFISMMMLARLGQAELAAGALAVSSLITINASLTSVFFAVGILIGYDRGQNADLMNVGKIVKAGIWLAIALTIPFAVILWNMDKLLFFVGEDLQLVLLTQSYFHFAALSLLPVMLNIVIGQFYAGIGNTRFTFYVSLVSLPLVIIASYAFILGNFGLPAMGLSGVSCAALVVQSIIFISVSLLIYLRSTYKRFYFFTNGWLPDMTTCKAIFTLGLPIGLQFGGEIAAMTAGTYMMGHFGVIPLAAIQAVGQYTLFIVMIFLGLCQALSILVSEALGKRDIAMVERYVRAAMILFGIISIVEAIFFLGFPEQLIKIYIGNDAGAQFNYYARIFFALNVIFLLFDGIRNLFSSALRGLHDSRVPMRIGIIALWMLSLPISYLFGFSLQQGPIGLRIGFLSGIIYCAFWLWLRYRRKLKQLCENALI